MLSLSSFFKPKPKSNMEAKLFSSDPNQRVFLTPDSEKTMINKGGNKNESDSTIINMNSAKISESVKHIIPTFYAGQEIFVQRSGGKKEGGWKVVDAKNTPQEVQNAVLKQQASSPQSTFVVCQNNDAFKVYKSEKLQEIQQS